MDDKTIAEKGDKIVRYAISILPNVEMYEIGALFLSAGGYLIAQSVPDMWPQLKPTVSLAHQLLNQPHDKDNGGANLKDHADCGSDRQGTE